GWRSLGLYGRALQWEISLAQAATLDRLGDVGQQLVVGPRFGDVVLRTALECGASRIDRGVGGNQHYRKIRVAAANLAQQLQAVAVRSCCARLDRKSTRLNSSHGSISYAVFCLKK